MAVFEKFLHVERLGKNDVEGILEGQVEVYPKLDGTNASVWHNSDNGNTQCGSRNRELTEEKDNAGFWKWVHSNDKEAVALRYFCTINPNIVVYGEFLGNEGGKFIGSIKSYLPEALGKLWIFDIWDRETNTYWSYEIMKNALSVCELEHWLIPATHMENPTLEELMDIAEKQRFLLPQEKKGEGIVIKNRNYRNPWGHQAMAKIVLDEFRQDKSKSKKVKIDVENIENSIVNKYTTDAEIAKSIAKVCVLMDIDEFDKKNGQCIGRLINMVWLDLLDESKNWVKEFKNPTVSFAKLRRMSDTKVRNYLGF